MSYQGSRLVEFVADSAGIRIDQVILRDFFFYLNALQTNVLILV